MYYMLFRYEYTNNAFARLILRYLFILRLLSFPRTLRGSRACSSEPVKPPTSLTTLHMAKSSQRVLFFIGFLRKALNEGLPCH